MYQSETYTCFSRRWLKVMIVQMATIAKAMNRMKVA